MDGTKPPWRGIRFLLFRQTLGERIPQDHTVRLLWEILDGLDWSSWERHYVLVAGQPPIRTTNLLERLFAQDRRRRNVLPHAFGERLLLKLMFASTLRASARRSVSLIANAGRVIVR